jgi:hypothetical protein
VFLELSVVLEVLGDLTDETLEGQLRRGWKKVSLDRRKVFLEAGSTSSLDREEKSPDLTDEVRGIGGNR